MDASESYRQALAHELAHIHIIVEIHTSSFPIRRDRQPGGKSICSHEEDTYEDHSEALEIAMSSGYPQQRPPDRSK